MNIRVYYEDTDAGGIVYHANYIKYCERARSELFFSRGIKPLEENGGGFVVHSLSADFVAPAKLGDMLEVKSGILSLRRTGMELLQEIYRDDLKIFSMKIKLAFVSNGRISRIPERFTQVLDNMI